jgi:hypothetical protein
MRSAGAASLALGLAAASATERYFTYTYEPETMPPAHSNMNNGCRAPDVQDRWTREYNKWELRHELSMGIDNYSLSLYINESSKVSRPNHT